MAALDTPKDHGAVGNGVTNDAAAFQSVCSAVGAGNAALVTPGIYLIGTSVTLSCSLLFAAGAVLKIANGITLTLSAKFVCDDWQQVFDTSLGGVVTIAAGQPKATPEMWGAKADGISNDSAAANAAFVAAKASGALFHFPNPTGSYRCNGPFNVTTSVKGITHNGSARVTPYDSSADCFTFAAGNYSGCVFDLPNVSDYTSGVGVRLLGGTSLINLTVDYIANCTWGLSLETDSGGNVTLNHTIEFNSIHSCNQVGGGAMRWTALNASSVQQGHRVTGNFMTGNTVGIQFKGSSGLPSFDGNIINIVAIDGTGATNSRGIAAENMQIPGKFEIYVAWFGGFGSEFVYLPNGSNNLRMSLGFNGLNSYSQLVIGGVGCTVRNTSGDHQNYRSAPIPANTTSGSRSTFNSGNPVATNSFTISLPIAAAAAGGVQDFYVYSPFTDGYSDRFSIEPVFVQPMLVTAIEDESVQSGIDGNTSANQVHIRVAALTAVTAHTSYATINIRG